MRKTNFLYRYGLPGVDGYNLAHYLPRPWEVVGEYYRLTKWFVQRGRRGYSDRDVWGWCDYMARVNVAALRHLAKSKMGHPIGMTMPSWRNRLLKMADGFQAFIDDTDDCTSYKRLSRKKFLALIKSRQRRTAAGLRLWSKHFWSLWD